MSEERDRDLDQDSNSGATSRRATGGAADLTGETGEYVGGEGGTAVGDDLGGGIGTGETDLGGGTDLTGDTGDSGPGGGTGQMAGETWGDRSTESDASDEAFGGGATTYQEDRGQGA